MTVTMKWCSYDRYRSHNSADSSIYETIEITLKWEEYGTASHVSYLRMSRKWLLNVQNLRFSQRCCRRFKPSGMLPVIGYRRFDGPKCPSPTELSSPKRSPTRNARPECEGTAFIRRTDNNLPVAKAWHSRFETSFIHSLIRYNNFECDKNVTTFRANPLKSVPWKREFADHAPTTLATSNWIHGTRPFF